MAESSLRALAKLVQVMPPRLRARVDALRAMTVTMAPGTSPREIDPLVLTTAAQACRDDERLLLAYTAADGATSQRTVEPHRLVSLGRRWYLVAYDSTARLAQLPAGPDRRSAARGQPLPPARAAGRGRRGLRPAGDAHAARQLRRLGARARTCRPGAARGSAGGRWPSLSTTRPAAPDAGRQPGLGCLRAGCRAVDITEVAPPELASTCSAGPAT
jgi:hypothetical protein